MAYFYGFQFVLCQHISDVLPSSATGLGPESETFFRVFSLCEDSETKSPVEDGGCNMGMRNDSVKTRTRVICLLASAGYGFIFCLSQVKNVM